MKIRHAEKNIPVMTKQEIDKFLGSGRQILRLATIDLQGNPAIHPVWYYHNNDRVYLFTGKNSRKLKNLKKNSKVYFSVDTDAQPNKGVRGRGTATIVQDQKKSIELAEKIVLRYLDDLKSSYGKGMIDYVRSGQSIVVEITPDHYTVWDYGKLMPAQ